MSCCDEALLLVPGHGVHAARVQLPFSRSCVVAMHLPERMGTRCGAAARNRSHCQQLRAASSTMACLTHECLIIAQAAC